MKSIKAIVAGALVAAGVGGLAATAAKAQECFLGEVRFFAGTFAPRSWAFARGQILPISSNEALFSILGTIYGGDGRTTFALPDIRGRFVIGAGEGPGLTSRPLGVKTGAENRTITANQMPSHSHAVNAVDAEGNSNVPTGHRLADADRDDIYSNAAANTQMASNMIANTGGGQPLDLMNPHLALHPIICLQGLYPSRS